MIVLRTVLAMIAGYVVYAFASMLLVGAVMAGDGAVILVVALVALALIGAVSGFLVAIIAGPKAPLAASICAGLIALATLANLVAGLGAEPTWYKLGTLVLTAPAVLLIGCRGRLRGSPA